MARRYVISKAPYKDTQDKLFEMGYTWGRSRGQTYLIPMNNNADIVIFLNNDMELTWVTAYNHRALYDETEINLLDDPLIDKDEIERFEKQLIKDYG